MDTFDMIGLGERIGDLREEFLGCVELNGIINASTYDKIYVGKSREKSLEIIISKLCESIKIKKETQAMSEVIVKIKFDDQENGVEHRLMPSRAHEDDAGLDIKSCEEVVIHPKQRYLVDTGFRMDIPVGYEAQIRSRSGHAIKKGLCVVNSPGTIDSGYRGLVKVGLINHGEEKVVIHIGDAIAQMVISKLPSVELKQVYCDLSKTRRGAGCFGSSGN